WDLAVGSEAAGASSAVMPSLVESLGGQSDESGEALWSALRLEGAAASLTPELAADLGRCLRMSVLTVFRLKAALDQAEQRLGGSVVPAPSGAAGILDDYP